jgi:hypothetical protein
MNILHAVTQRFPGRSLFPKVLVQKDLFCADEVYKMRFSNLPGVLRNQIESDK